MTTDETRTFSLLFLIGAQPPEEALRRVEIGMEEDGR